MPYYIKKKSKGNAVKSATSTLIHKLDDVFSKYIRLRDTMHNGYFRCISCGRVLPYEQADAGHFHSRTHMNTRFDERNVHAECRFCNRFSADHLIKYQENLIHKIGQREFDLLNVRAHMARKWSSWELEELIKMYKDKIKELQDVNVELQKNTD